MSQKDFGKIFNLSESTIGMYERDERKPDFDTLIQISEYFNVSTDYLLKGKDFSSEAEKIFDNANTQIAARDGEISREEAIKAIEWLLENEKDRKPGDKQPRRKKFR
uniref:helix-turn-helix domain-containing protein n=1 Tax=Metabacillus halosaccharovorans TaxID=930124 RepID=UPI003F65B69C